MLRLMKNVAPLFILLASLATTACSDSTTAPLVASAITKVSGDAQSAAIATALPQPVVVKVLDQNGAALAGATVNWSLVNGSGDVLSATTSVTDASGLAQVVWTLGTVAGTETLAASTGSYSTDFSAIAMEDASSSARSRAQ